MNNISILHAISTIHPSHGGPSRSVVQLVDAIANFSELDVSLVTQCFAGDPNVQSRNLRVNRKVLSTSSNISLKLGLPGRNYLSEIAKTSPPAIFHSHGIVKSQVA